MFRVTDECRSRSETAKHDRARIARRSATLRRLASRRGTCVLLAVIVAAVALSWPRAVRGAEGTTSWLVGGALRQKMDSAVSGFWTGTPLRQALGNLSRAQRVAVILDRRVDPEQRVDLKLSSTPLSSALRQLAESRELGVALLGSVAYLGPGETAARLRTVAALREEDARRLGPAIARRLLHAKRMAWADFATPRDLLAQLAEEAGLEITNAQRVPHDLWAAADLPPLSWVDRVTLVTIQFDLTFRVADDGRSIELVDLPKDVFLVRNYPAGVNPAPLVARIKEVAPAAQAKIVGDRVHVRGLLEDHERIASPSSSRSDRPARQPSSAGKVVISRFAVQEKPVGRVLEQLAAGLKLELRIDRQALQDAGISLDQRVSVVVENASVDDAFRQLLRTTSLDFRRDGSVIEIVPK